mmetsp:Transcript_26328/g.84735  ORF Transcript_26328/g.84735 Transcript_26328/m.84735 type:complete len:204 (+) Transcript_26328:2508-3119(+)
MRPPQPLRAGVEKVLVNMQAPTSSPLYAANPMPAPNPATAAWMCTPSPHVLIMDRTHNCTSWNEAHSTASCSGPLTNTGYPWREQNACTSCSLTSSGSTSSQSGTSMPIRCAATIAGLDTSARASVSGMSTRLSASRSCSRDRRVPRTFFATGLQSAPAPAPAAAAAASSSSSSASSSSSSQSPSRSSPPSASMSTSLSSVGR